MHNKDSTGGPNRYICYKLGKVMRKIQRYYENNLSSYGITPVQFYVLSALWEEEGLKFKELAGRLNIDGSTLTGILDRMEKGGFVERRDDPEDRRSLLVFLTDKSRKYGREMMHLAENLDREIRKQFAEKDFATFEQVLDRLAESVD